MLFSSIVFIFVFLPIVLIIYYVLLKNNRKYQNVFLLISSLIFYAWGEPWFVLIMIFSIILNWLYAIQVSKSYTSIRKRIIIIIMLISNLGILFIYKYLKFFIANLNAISFVNLNVPAIVLPIGISFFTFQAISYVVDISRGDGEVQKSPLNVGLYIGLFPQLIAGPIVRYKTISEQILYRKESINCFNEGVKRFIIGLTKKMVIANTIALIADNTFNNNISTLSVMSAWLGAIAFTLQIYFDFSGYSDMAIGLGKMFGFEFLENFDYPYISKSISEFWRRWHISLGTWFRDYVYIPLGGSRVRAKSRLIINLFIVWILTGIWHGANWTFITWGALYFILLSFEKLTRYEKVKLPVLIKRIYTLGFVIFGWVLFKSNSLLDAFEYMKSMLGLNQNSFVDLLFFINIKENYFVIISAIMFSTPIFSNLRQKFQSKSIFANNLFEISTLLVMLLISFTYVIKGSYNPFIYFNF